jgi:tetratricopeptide (TPR) repeat protein
MIQPMIPKPFALGLLIAVALVSGCQPSKLAGAKLRIQEGNYDIAARLAQEVLAEDPGDADAHFVLGLAYSYLDEVGEAYESFVTSKRLDPSDDKRNEIADNNIRHNFSRHYNAGQIAYGADNYEAAAAEFRLATEADPRDANGFFNLGVTCAKLGAGRIDLAVDALDRSIALLDEGDGRLADVLAASARVLASAGRVSESTARFRRLIEIDPDRHAVVEGVGRELLDRREWRYAISFLEIAAAARAETSTEDFELYYNIGIAWYNLRETDRGAPRRAIDYYRRALGVRPDEPQTVLNISVAHAFLREWTDAIYFGEKYVASTPDNARAWRLLARCYSETGDQNKARECLARSEHLRDN